MTQTPQMAQLLGQVQTLYDAQTTDLTTCTAELADTQRQLAEARAALAAVPKPTVPVAPTLFGVDGQPLDITSYPHTKYCREYTPPGKGAKLVQSPASVTLPHLSEKDTPTPALERPLYDSLNRKIIDEWNHEPEGDMTTADYIAGVKALHSIRDQHPNGHFVLIAQTFTRYAQVHGKTMTDGKPASWQNLWVEGSDLIGFDCEVDSSIKGGYPDPVTFFAPAVAASKQLGVPFLIPELGWPQQASDADGSGLAKWYVACAAYLRTQNCAGVAAFNQQGTTGNYLLSGPAKAAWQTVVSSQ